MDSGFKIVQLLTLAGCKILLSVAKKNSLLSVYLGDTVFVLINLVSGIAM